MKKEASYKYCPYRQQCSDDRMAADVWHRQNMSPTPAHYLSLAHPANMLE